MSAPDYCPQCGVEVPERAQSCPGCGADEETGWNDRATAQRLGIDDPDDFDTEEYQASETAEQRGHARPRWVTATAIVLLVLTAVGLVLVYTRR